jgi:actin-like protein 6A
VRALEVLVYRSAITMLSERSEYELPDGAVVSLGEQESAIPESLFNPALMKVEHKARNFALIVDQGFVVVFAVVQDYDILGFKGVHQMVLDSINKCDMDLRKEMLANIIVTGGNSLLNGFVERLQKKLYDIAPQVS